MDEPEPDEFEPDEFEPDEFEPDEFEPDEEPFDEPELAGLLDDPPSLLVEEPDELESFLPESRESVR